MRVRWLLTAAEYDNLPAGTAIARHIAHSPPLTKQADGTFTDGKQSLTATDLDGQRYMVYTYGYIT